MYHEILHALGLIHEHARNDRNDYVDLCWNRIQSKEPKINPIIENIFSINNINLLKGTRVHNYQRYTGAFWRDKYGVGTPYDFKSVMHYPDSSQIIIKKVCFVTFLYVIKISKSYFYFLKTFY